MVNDVYLFLRYLFYLVMMRFYLILNGDVFDLI